MVPQGSDLDRTVQVVSLVVGLAQLVGMAVIVGVSLQRLNALAEMFRTLEDRFYRHINDRGMHRGGGNG